MRYAPGASPRLPPIRLAAAVLAKLDEFLFQYSDSVRRAIYMATGAAERVLAAAGAAAAAVSGTPAPWSSSTAANADSPAGLGVRVTHVCIPAGVLL